MLRLPRPARWQRSIHKNCLSGDGRGLSNSQFQNMLGLNDTQHVGIRRYSQFLSQIYDLLDDDGIFVLQVAGFRPSWQYEDLIWGLFMNKYIFPGADASCSLGWVIGKVCYYTSLADLTRNDVVDSWKVLDLRSRTSMFWEFITLRPSIAGTRTGYRTRKRCWPSMVNVGTGSGCSSLHTV